MRKEYDFKNAIRGAVLPSPGKTRITIMLDDDVIESFRQRAEAAGRGYQTLMNEALRAAMDPESAPVSARMMRTILDERLKQLPSSQAGKLRKKPVVSISKVT